MLKAVNSLYISFHSLKKNKNINKTLFICLLVLSWFFCLTLHGVQIYHGFQSFDVPMGWFSTCFIAIFFFMQFTSDRAAISL